MEVSDADRAKPCTVCLHRLIVEASKAGGHERLLPTPIGQRVFALAFGSTDQVDHDEFRFNSVPAALSGKREAKHSDCARLASRST